MGCAPRRLIASTTESKWGAGRVASSRLPKRQHLLRPLSLSISGRHWILLALFDSIAPFSFFQWVPDGKTEKKTNGTTSRRLLGTGRRSRLLRIALRMGSVYIFISVVIKTRPFVSCAETTATFNPITYGLFVLLAEGTWNSTGCFYPVTSHWSNDSPLPAEERSRFLLLFFDSFIAHLIVVGRLTTSTSRYYQVALLPSGDNSETADNPEQ